MRELRALDVHPTNLHQLQDAILSTWANISKECFQHLVESMARRIKAVLMAKGGQTQYQCGVPNNPLGECISPCRCVVIITIMNKAAQNNKIDFFIIHTIGDYIRLV